MAVENEGAEAPKRSRKPAKKRSAKKRPASVTPRFTAEKEWIVRKNLTAENRSRLYGVARWLGGETRDRLSLQVPCTVYVQDPEVAANHVELGLHEIRVRWEPALGPGPTSARVAVVDYDADTGELHTPVIWDQDEFSFRRGDKTPIPDQAESRQFRQVNAWAQVQRVLEYYEHPRALGRSIPWGFEGSRLLIVPHAGYQNNAFYDRRSKSLQFYYYGDPQKLPRYTCLSHDILSHEAGHAVLDGIRPHFLENTSWETAAFHEFIGDLTAVLLTMRNNEVRDHLWKEVGADLEDADAAILSSVAEEFGRHVEDRPFLRSARDPKKYREALEVRNAHDASQVLTGAMFDILVAIARQYLNKERQDDRSHEASAADALWWAINGFSCIALQPLDLLAPADVRFADYARAVLRNHEILDPADEHGYRHLMRRVFHRRGLCALPYEQCKKDPRSCDLAMGKPPEFSIYHAISEIGRSCTSAYYFLHDNRAKLGIPPFQDFAVIDVYDALKSNSADERLPRQVVVQYLWREAVSLDGPEFGKLRGKKVELLCGGTLVFDDRGNLLSWAFKRGRGTPEGERRYRELREHVARQIATRRLGLQDGLDAAVPAGPAQPPVVAREVGGLLRLETTPHGCALDDESEEETWTTRFF